MQAALVIGSTRAIVKHDSLDGKRMVIIQMLGVNDAADGPPLIAVDAVGCRKGDRVVATSDGRYARKVTNSDNTPARWSIIGIIDQV